jgi:hypothetical protein
MRPLARRVPVIAVLALWLLTPLPLARGQVKSQTKSQQGPVSGHAGPRGPNITAGQQHFRPHRATVRHARIVLCKQGVVDAGGAEGSVGCSVTRIGVCPLQTGRVGVPLPARPRTRRASGGAGQAAAGMGQAVLPRRCAGLLGLPVWRALMPCVMRRSLSLDTSSLVPLAVDVVGAEAGPSTTAALCYKANAGVR